MNERTTYIIVILDFSAENLSRMKTRGYICRAKWKSITSFKTDCHGEATNSRHQFNVISIYSCTFLSSFVKKKRGSIRSGNK